MAVLPIGIGSAAGGGAAGAVERSLRFNSADSAYLNRTFSSGANTGTWTWSGWVKRSSLGTQQNIFYAAGSAPTAASILFTSSDQFRWYQSNGTTSIITTQVFRDTSAWYHFVVVMDTTNGTSTDRLRMYVNGSRITAFASATYPSSGGSFNNNVAHAFGRDNTYAYEYFGGYLAETYFIDGQALTPSSFGETDSNTGVWKPKAFSGTYGTNGFYLKFADNSGATSTTLGKDSSGNGNNWTPNNFSVTAGAGNDSLVDTPTSYGTDTGVGGTVRGNYCTYNSTEDAATQGTRGGGGGGTLSNGNLQLYRAAGANSCISGTVSVSSGKWYWEITGDAAGNGWSCGVRLANSYAIDENYWVGYSTGKSNEWGYIGSTGNKANGTTGTSYGNTFGANTIGVALDLDNGKIWFSKDGTWQASGDPAAGTNAAFTNVSGTVMPRVSANGQNLNANFGQRAFAYTAPSGFKALCTQNLPTPTIGATSTTQANDYFNAVLYTGNGGTQTVSGVGFQPDFVWAKGRSVAYSNRLYDVIRGATNSLVSNNTDGEATLTTQLTAFASDGFTLGSDVGLNQSSATYVAWNWKAGSSTVTNTSGTISAQVRANTTSGCSIVTYTGNGTNGATIGHGLSSAPKMFITKNRNGYNSSNGFADWSVYHVNSPVYTGGAAIDGTARQALWLHQTAAASNGVGGFPKGPTSTVFTPNQSAYDNASGQTYVAYCFAEIVGFSAFGKYTGNGSADGPFVYLGFRPRYILRKRTDSTGGWLAQDSSRPGYNATTTYSSVLYPNASDAETIYNEVDILSNGFKIRATDTFGNASGGTYIYMAFAEHPFKYSLAR